MATGRPAAFAALAALGLALASAGASAQASRDSGGASRDAASLVARALLDEARQDAGIGDWADASACLDEAVVKDPGDADIRYLRALASLRSSLPLDAALGDLDAALATGRFSYYSRGEASSLKAELLVRERRWKEAIGALDPASGDSSADPAYRLIRARAFAGLGDSRSLTAELAAGLKRFPDNPSFARLFLSRAGKLPSSEEARALRDIVLGRLPRYAETDPEIPVLAAPLMADLGAKRDAVLAFRAKGNSSPAATLRALEYGLIDEPKAAEELLATSPRVALDDLSALLALAGSPAGREAVIAALSAWSGTIETDADGDGVREGSFSLVKGLTTLIELDSGQRGTVDLRASFSSGLPGSATIERAGGRIAVSYSSYPSVSSVSFDDGLSRRGYSFGPEALSYAPFAMRPFAGEGRTAIFFPYALPVADPSERQCAALALSVAVESGQYRVVTVLEEGRSVSSAAYEGGRLVSTTAYSRGRPSLERIDRDGDGRFEAERLYLDDSASEQRASRLVMDVDGDGVFEYSEESDFPFRKTWDFDGDGSVDAQQLALADGSIRQEFSSRLDGRLDEAVVVLAGKIVSLSRDGVALPLVQDVNQRLKWIGKKPFDIGASLPKGEGIFSAQGKRYRLTRVGDLAFAELVP